MKTQKTNTAVKHRKPRTWSKLAEKRGYTLPVKLECHVTGKIVKYTNPTYIDKKIQEYGSLKALQRKFVSREGQSKINEAVIELHSGGNRRSA